MIFLEPFQYDFMLEAFAVSAFIGAVCAVFSCFLILKGWALMGDAISHAVLPGIVLAFVAGVPLAIGAFASGLFCSLGIGFVKNTSRLKEDTVMGVIFTGLFALGMVLFSKIESDQHLNHILFGNLLGVTPAQIRETFFIGTVTLLGIFIFRRALLLFCFDPVHARAIGQSNALSNFLMLALLALTIVTSLKAVGIILVVAMLVTPGCVGFLLANRFWKMMAVSLATAILSAFAGVYFSFFLNGATGPCIVLTQTFVFILALLLSPKRGMSPRQQR